VHVVSSALLGLRFRGGAKGKERSEKEDSPKGKKDENLRFDQILKKHLEALLRKRKIQCGRSRTQINALGSENFKCGNKEMT